MKRLVLSLFLGILLVGFVVAVQAGNGNSDNDNQMVGNDEDEHGCKASAGYSWCAELNECIRSWETNCSGNQVQLQNQNRIQNQGEETMILTHEEKQMTLQVGESIAETELNITPEQDQERNRTRLKVKLSNGLNAEIKIMPNTASERALEVLRAKCAERNCSIQLKETGTGNQTRAVYEIKAQKQVRVLGLFKAQMQVQAQIDAENGETVQIKKPWWRIIAVEQTE